jgi:carbon-monoxide dehydrogenase medium subunit
LSSQGMRIVAARDFFDGVWSTTMQSGELLVGLTFPIWTGRCGFAIEEFARRYGDFAIAGAVIGVRLDAADQVTNCAIGLIGLGSTPERASTAETSVLGKNVTDIEPKELAQLAVSDLEAIPFDIHGSADYRKRVGAAMVARAWTTAAAEAQGV